MITQKSITIVKSTAPILAECGEKITEHFYRNLFKQHPALLHIFNQANQKTGRQKTALANTLYAAAQSIDQLNMLLPAVKQIAHKHRSIGVKPEHYPIVGEFLLNSMKEILQEKATDEVLAAWKEAYDAIASVFIAVEKELYEEANNKRGGWMDYKEFIITKKVAETKDVYSFYLKPVDNEPLPSFLPGQYVSIRVSVPCETYSSIRQYSLSDEPNNSYYKITVKREQGVEEGVVSAYLHDQLQEGDRLEFSAPAGDFILQDHDKPVVFISGGVGVTPIISMLKQALKEEKDVTFIHSTTNSSTYIMKEEINELSAQYSFRKYIAYSQPIINDREEKAFDREGRIGAEQLKSWCSNTDALFYICGSPSFTKSMIHALKDINVSGSAIQYESFGPKMSMSVSE
ncbi:NO-inducible flavohemoprotein [Priestia megaterium]|nr:NO-inducible flavohemoprotein [Priestia megaterium]